MSNLSNLLSRLVIASLPRRKKRGGWLIVNVQPGAGLSPTSRGGRKHMVQSSPEIQLDSGPRATHGGPWSFLAPPLSQFSSLTQLCPTLCDPMDCSTPGLPVHHQLLELAQTHVHWVSDAIQPSHPLSSLSSPTFNLSQHQGLFKWVSSLHKVSKVLEFQLQH